MTYNPDLCAASGLHQALNNDPALALLLGTPARLYDQAPEDPIYPYLTYGTARCEDIGGDESPLTAHIMTLHLWSRYGGRAEMLDLMAAMRGAVENSGAYFSDCHLVSANVLYTDIFRANDGRTLHGVMRLALRLEPMMEAA